MKFDYTGRHVEVTDAIRNHVESHFSKLEHLFNDSTAHAHIRIEVEKNRHKGEITLHWREHMLTAKDINSDMYQALSRALDKIEKQAIKLKKKIIDRNHQAEPTSVMASTTEQEVEPAPTGPRIIETDRYPVKPMTAEEAALRLSEEEIQFLVFRDAATDRIAVLYRRNDGNFGLIEPT